MLLKYIKKIEYLNWISNVAIVIFLLLSLCHIITINLYGSLICLITLAFNIAKANCIRTIKKNI